VQDPAPPPVGGHHGQAHDGGGRGRRFLLMTMADFADQLFDAAWEVLGVTLHRQTGTRWKETGSGWVRTKKKLELTPSRSRGNILIYETAPL
jgi:hypothetical protein